MDCFLFSFLFLVCVICLFFFCSLLSRLFCCSFVLCGCFSFVFVSEHFVPVLKRGVEEWGGEFLRALEFCSNASEPTKTIRRPHDRCETYFAERRAFGETLLWPISVFSRLGQRSPCAPNKQKHKS